MVVIRFSEVDGTREQHDTNEQKEHEQAELSHAGAYRLPEDLQSLGVAGQLEYAEHPDQSDHPQYCQRHGTVAGSAPVVGDCRAQREKIRRDSDDVDDVHDITKERDVIGGRRKPNQQLGGKPDDADCLDDEERFRKQRHVVVMLQHAVR